MLTGILKEAPPEGRQRFTAPPVVANDDVVVLF
jgi:hypothetical protein